MEPRLKIGDFRPMISRYISETAENREIILKTYLIYRIIRMKILQMSTSDPIKYPQTTTTFYKFCLVFSIFATSENIQISNLVHRLNR